MLLLATVFWGVSFPVMKSIQIVQHALAPENGSWFVTASMVVFRFGLSGLALALWRRPSWRDVTRLEIYQGVGLGLFGGAGLLFQMDGLAYTSASTSAFLTQAYCVILPILAAARSRRWPSWPIVIGSVLVCAGVAILSNVRWGQWRMGRGEWETILSSVLFTGQILCLEERRFRNNRTTQFTLVMFGVMALSAAPVALGSMHAARDWLIIYHSPALLGFVLILVFLCTLTAYVMMNHWQPFISAAEAGLIYAAEPLFASLFALFLPGWFAAWGGFDYPNELVTKNLLIGGSLITAANLLIQFSAARET